VKLPSAFSTTPAVLDPVLSPQVIVLAAKSPATPCGLSSMNVATATVPVPAPATAARFSP